MGRYSKALDLYHRNDNIKIFYSCAAFIRAYIEGRKYILNKGMKVAHSSCVIQPIQTNHMSTISHNFLPYIWEHNHPLHNIKCVRQTVTQAIFPNYGIDDKKRNKSLYKVSYRLSSNIMSGFYRSFVTNFYNEYIPILSKIYTDRIGGKILGESYCESQIEKFYKAFEGSILEKRIYNSQCLTSEKLEDFYKFLHDKTL